MNDDSFTTQNKSVSPKSSGNAFYQIIIRRLKQLVKILLFGR